MYQCQICAYEAEPFISFGRMPIANGFLTPAQFEYEYFFDLIVGYCPKCKMVQLLEFVDRGKMFHEQYAFFSSTSSFMARHFGMFAEKVMQGFLAESATPLLSKSVAMTVSFLRTSQSEISAISA